MHSDRVKPNTFLELKKILGKCRNCFQKVIYDKPDMHGANGRLYMIAIVTDLVANGATEDHIKLFAKLMYQQDYNENVTLQELKEIDPSKTWRCETLREKLSEYVNFSQCEKCAVLMKK